MLFPPTMGLTNAARICMTLGAIAALRRPQQNLGKVTTVDMVRVNSVETVSTFKAKSSAGTDWCNIWIQFGRDNGKLKAAWLNELTCFSVASALFMTYAYAVLVIGTDGFAEDIDVRAASTAVVITNSLCGTFSLLCVVVGSTQYVTSNKVDDAHILEHINNMYDRRGLNALLVITDPWLAFTIAAIFLFISVVANSYAFYGYDYCIMCGISSLIGFSLWGLRENFEHKAYAMTLRGSMDARSHGSKELGTS